MDKNLISVDNLVKQRLGGVEQKEREGAWLQMRELLDKEMPQNKPVGFDWRRSVFYAGMVLLASSLGIGAYDLGKHTNFFTTDKTTTPVVSNNHAGNNELNTTVPGSENSGRPQINDNNSSNSKLAANTLKHSAANTDNNTVGNKTSKNVLASSSRQIIGQKTTVVSNNTTDALKSTADKSHSNRSNNGTKSNNSKTNVAIPGTNENSRQEDNNALANNKNITGNSTSVKTQEAGKHLVTSSSVATNKSIGKNSVKGDKTHNRIGKGNNNTPSNNVTKNSTEPKEDKITINKVVLNKHFVHDESNGGYYTFDTISKEKLFEQLHSITEVADATKDTKSDPMENAVASNSTSAGSSNSSNAKEILSSSSPSLKSLPENKASGQEKKSAGAKMLDNLSSAFNDVKYTAGNMSFTKGITAGANGTFFGPTSFYGFQFGVTGSFNFGDNVSIVTELKYFEKINSNYELNDDYYQYEQINGAGSGYRKSKMDYDFSFSTLHSFELPISLKYNINNFSVFAGGNFLYIFGINTGAVALPDLNTQAVNVSTIGNDNHATLSYNDFGQRFGIGYLFGISFKIAPNAAIDLRSVQTVWESLKSGGAQTVSNTLYNIPSLQLSFNYTFGSNKKGNSK